MSGYKLLRAGDTALIIEFGDSIDRAINRQVLGIADRLRAARLNGVIEVVPTFRSVLVQYDPLQISWDNLTAHAKRLVAGREPERAGRQWRLPVCYNSQLAPDLEEVAARTNLSIKQVVESHCATTYHVYMLGFLPGQAYMGDVSTELLLPRRETPRAKIPAGSLGIATAMTCIFPQETPSGWHIIGRSPVRLWDKTTDSIALLAPGDKITFSPVSMSEYEDLLGKGPEGCREVNPTNMVEAA